MKNKIVYVIFSLIAGLFILNACRHEILNPGNGSGGGGTGGGGNLPPTSNCNPASVYFVNDIMPLISSNCTMSGCHDNITHADGVNLTTYTKIMGYVRPGDAANSKLYKVIIKTDGDRMPPPPMAPMTTAQKAQLYLPIAVQ